MNGYRREWFLHTYGEIFIQPVIQNYPGILAAHLAPGANDGFKFCLFDIGVIMPPYFPAFPGKTHPGFIQDNALAFQAAVDQERNETGDDYKYQNQ
jgi:hypothetical protein